MVAGGRGQDIFIASDGLPALSVAGHSREKQFQLRSIADIFARAMKGKWDDGIYYVDLFSGPGKCILRDSGEEIAGSPLVASEMPFDHFYLADSNSVFLDALKGRLSGAGLPEDNFHFYVGEADDVVGDILMDLPPARSSLGFAFLDPWAWDFSFRSLERLTQGRRMDVLVNFNIGDLKRDWLHPLHRLDSFLNLPCGHRDFFGFDDGGEVSVRMLLDHYESQLRGIGYHHVADDIPVTNSKNTPLYHIIFGSKNPLGKRLRDAVSKRTASGQFKMGLEFD